MTIKRTTKALLATAASFALIGTAAHAADLDAVSDDDLLERIERLEKIIGPGDKYAVRSGTNKVRVTLNGQINQQVRYANDGVDSAVQFLDHDASSTRFRILGDVKLNDKFSVSTALEFDIETNRDGTIGLQNLDNSAENAADPDNDFDIRRAEILFRHADFGTLFLGQGNVASDGTAEKDLSGTQIAQSNGGNDFGLAFRSSITNVIVPGIARSAFFDGGAGRNNRVRYDTPTFAGFRAGISIDGRGDFDVGLHFNKKDLAGFDISAGFGYANLGRANARGTLGGGLVPLAIAGNPTGVFSRINGSIGILHRGSGLNFYAAGGTTVDQANVANGVFATNINAGRTSFFEVQGGWKGNIFDFGSTAFAVAYHRGNIRTNTLIANTFTRQRPQIIAVKAVQKIDKLSMELYARYSRYFTRVNTTLLGVTVNTPIRAQNVVAVGARVKF